MEPSKKILVVEDEHPLRKALVDKLTREGFMVIEAKNGAEGLAQIATHEPDLILSDIIMPVMDGVTMLNQYRNDSALRQVPVIALTNLNSIENVADVVSNGANSFLTKSNWKIADVVENVKANL